jgi:hypothetical protein
VEEIEIRDPIKDHELGSGIKGDLRWHQRSAPPDGESVMSALYAARRSFGTFGARLEVAHWPMEIA